VCCSPAGVVADRGCDGRLILTITASLLYFADVSSFYQSLIDGVILLAVVGSSAPATCSGLVRQ
jgi:ribose/xylose/arabinose/galactoside ABC-type transport system permease subunit